MHTYPYLSDTLSNIGLLPGADLLQNWDAQVTALVIGRKLPAY